MHKIILIVTLILISSCKKDNPIIIGNYYTNCDNICIKKIDNYLVTFWTNLDIDINKKIGLRNNDEKYNGIIKIKTYYEIIVEFESKIPQNNYNIVIY